MANVRTTLIGGIKVTEEQVRATETPPETRSHVPVPHGEFLDMVDSTLGGFGWDITEQRYALEGGKIEVGGEDVRYDTARLFGVLKIQREDVAIGQDYQLAIGIRNSHDKTMSAGMVAGLLLWFAAIWISWENSKRVTSTASTCVGLCLHGLISWRAKSRSLTLTTLNWSSPTRRRISVRQWPTIYSSGCVMLAPSHGHTRLRF